VKRVAIVQARMTSTRLPGKILKPLLGEPMLQRQIARMRTAEALDEIVIATTNGASDDEVAELAHTLDVRCVRGSEGDVLGRYVLAAVASDAELVVRITADCPLIDGGVIDRIVKECETRASELDFVSNTLQRTFPRGLDVEAFYLDTLLRMDRQATSPTAREHVTYHLYAEQPALYRQLQIKDAVDHSALRWTVDTPLDFA
jgi:spore coat polysaccharide biosynthesis protein SpsF